MIRRPLRSTRTDTLFPITTLFRSPLSPGTRTYPQAVEKEDSVPRLSTPNRLCASQAVGKSGAAGVSRSAEHTSELQSLMRNSSAVFCLKNKKTQIISRYTVKPFKYNFQHTYIIEYKICKEFN